MFSHEEPAITVEAKGSWRRAHLLCFFFSFLPDTNLSKVRMYLLFRTISKFGTTRARSSPHLGLWVLGPLGRSIFFFFPTVAPRCTRSLLVKKISSQLPFSTTRHMARCVFFPRPRRSHPSMCFAPLSFFLVLESSIPTSPCPCGPRVQRPARSGSLFRSG